jgi:hypothetical protein
MNISAIIVVISFGHGSLLKSLAVMLAREQVTVNDL